jgi:hypothetical protein
MFMNSVSGLTIAGDLVEEALGRPTEVLNWLNYEKHDSPRRQLVRTIVRDGLTDASRSRLAELEPAERITLALDLFDRGRQEEAFGMGEQAVSERPTAGSHYRLGDAFLQAGNLESAGRHFAAALKA